MEFCAFVLSLKLRGVVIDFREELFTAKVCVFGNDVVHRDTGRLNVGRMSGGEGAEEESLLL